MDGWDKVRSMLTNDRLRLAKGERVVVTGKVTITGRTARLLRGALMLAEQRGMGPEEAMNHFLVLGMSRYADGL